MVLAVRLVLGLRHLFVHELAHFRHHDIALNWLAASSWCLAQSS
jgi:beta-lactamase regulating signal transducer with metallopeptidase domain